MRSVELFAGGGGLALGMHLAGFTTEVVAEWDRWCCDTLRENQATGHPLVQGMDVREGDVRDIDWSDYAGQIDVVSGGPPCQPFSGGGKGVAQGDMAGRGLADSRTMPFTVIGFYPDSGQRFSALIHR